MEKKTKVLEVAKFIIENKATIKTTADHFGMSISSIKKYINNDLKEIDEKVYNSVKIVQANIEELARIQGGKIGKRGPKYTDSEAVEIAKVMIANQMTLDEASKYFQMPRSSIYDKVININDIELVDEIKRLFEKNKQEFAPNLRNNKKETTR